MVRAMLPTLQKALESSNTTVVQASLGSMRRVEQMFGRGAMDEHAELFAEVLKKQTASPGGNVRAGLILGAVAGLCSQEVLADLQQRFPEAVRCR